MTVCVAFCAMYYQQQIICQKIVLWFVVGHVCRQYTNIEKTALTATSKSYLCMKWPDGERLYYTAGKNVINHM